MESILKELDSFIYASNPRHVSTDDPKWDVMSESWSDQFDLENIDISNIDPRAAYFWWIHPGYMEKSEIMKWKEFLEQVFGRNALVFLDQCLYHTHINLKRAVTSLKDNGQLYLNGWMGRHVTEEFERTIKEHHNIMLGVRFGYCVKNQYEYIRNIAPLDRITMLNDYSFSGNNYLERNSALHYYEKEGVYIHHGTVSELLDNLQ